MNQEQELKDKTDLEMYEHMHGNDESSAMIDEQSIQNSREEEMKLQEEYHREKMEKEQQTLDLLRRWKRNKNCRRNICVKSNKNSKRW